MLPFPEVPSASLAKPRLQESIQKRRVVPDRLPLNAPNIVIILMDDCGFGKAEAFGGFAHTPTLDKVAEEGIRYNRFHNTPIWSPTRASLLTGRNHQRVSSGSISERAIGWEGSTGTTPKTAATLPKALGLPRFGVGGCGR